jgi:hypothetical protein
MPVTVIMAKAFGSRISRWSLALVLAFSVVVWISLDVWTAPAGILWHLFHGRSTIFAGEKIVVPWDMWVDGSSQSIAITREAAKYGLLNSPWGTIVLARGEGQRTNMVTDYGRIARSEEQLPKGFRLRLVREVRLEKRKGYCWESSRVDTPELMISCHFDNETFSAAFRGNSKYSNVFYEAISTDLSSGKDAKH